MLNLLGPSASGHVIVHNFAVIHWCAHPPCKALNTEQWSDGEPAEAEKDFWEIAAMEAYNHLMEWKSLQYCSTVYIDEASPPNLEKMWAEPLHQVHF